MCQLNLTMATIGIIVTMCRAAGGANSSFFPPLLGSQWPSALARTWKSGLQRHRNLVFAQVGERLLHASTGPTLQTTQVISGLPLLKWKMCKHPCAKMKVWLQQKWFCILSQRSFRTLLLFTWARELVAVFFFFFTISNYDVLCLVAMTIRILCWEEKTTTLIRLKVYRCFENNVCRCNSHWEAF